jgi:hypothetical protein
VTRYWRAWTASIFLGGFGEVVIATDLQHQRYGHLWLPAVGLLAVLSAGVRLKRLDGDTWRAASVATVGFYSLLGVLLVAASALFWVVGRWTS